jgi:general secretion pathway protein B
MSYILDALRRADAERDRGVVPSLHSHVMTHAASTARRTASPPSISTPWVLGLGGGLLVLGGAVYWGLQERPVKPVVASPTVRCGARDARAVETCACDTCAGRIRAR